MIISRTPFRISFFGGGTDYPVWYERNKGAVLSTTIDKYCYINIRYLPPFFEHKHRIAYSIVENVKSIKQIKHPVARVLLDMFKIKNGVELHHDGDLPARSGLGSSSAFTVGMLNALYALQGKIISKADLANLAIHTERDILKENVGSQDQVAVAYGGLNKITFQNGHNFKIEPITLNRERILRLQEHLVLIFTGFSRFSSEIAKDQIRNAHKNTEELNQMLEMVDEAIEVLNNNKRDINDFGRLLHESWLLKRKLSSKISNTYIDNLYQAARKGGAIGGKLLGAGGGGFMLFFVPPERRQKVHKAIRRALEVKFAFENNGSQIIYYNPQPI